MDWKLEIRNWMQDAECKMQDAGYRIQEI